MLEHSPAHSRRCRWAGTRGMRRASPLLTRRHVVQRRCSTQGSTMANRHVAPRLGSPISVAGDAASRLLGAITFCPPRPPDSGSCPRARLKLPPLGHPRLVLARPARGRILSLVILHREPSVAPPSRSGRSSVHRLGRWRQSSALLPPDPASAQPVRAPGSLQH